MGSNSSVTVREAITDVEIKRKRFEWTMRNLSFLKLCHEEDKEYLNGPLFKSSKFDNDTWSMKSLFENKTIPGLYGQCESFLSCILKYHSKVHGKSKYMVTGKLIISDMKGNELKFHSIHNLLHDGSEFKVSMEYDTISVDTIKVVADFQFAVYQPRSDIECTENNSQHPKDIFESTELCNDFEELLVSPQHHDFTIHVDDETFQGHKAVFAARSPVFKAMFEHPLKEQIENEVEITDTTPDTWRLFQRFLYTARVSVDGTNLSECAALLFLADKYQVTSLSTELGEIIESTLTKDNILEFLRLSMPLPMKTTDEAELVVVWRSNTVQNNKYFDKKSHEFPDTIPGSFQHAFALFCHFVLIVVLLIFLSRYFYKYASSGAIFEKDEL